METKEQRKILASYNQDTIRVYQAYNHTIADECLRKGTFGPSFSFQRMTWIKPSFLWMMYRAGWAEKPGQERVLGIDIVRSGFEMALSQVVLATYESDIYGPYEEWQRLLSKSDVRCQWDPDRDIYGHRLNRRAIQLGLQGNIVWQYVNEWIVHVEDMTPKVRKWKEAIDLQRFELLDFPMEIEYSVDDSIQKRLGMR